MTPAVRLFDSGLLSFLPAALREPQRAWLAILMGAALTLTGSLALSAVVATIMPTVAKPEFPTRGWDAFLKLVLFAPLVETLVMAAVLTGLAIFLSPTVAVLITALLAGVAHSYVAAAWGLVIWWPFLIFSTLYLVWRERSTAAAIGVASTTHALQNLFPAWAIAFT